MLIKFNLFLRAKIYDQKIIDIIKQNVSMKLEKKILKLKKNHSSNHPYDDKHTSFLKYLLQSQILNKSKRKIINLLFKKIVTNNEKAFAKKLYLSKKDVLHLYKKGMYIGCHGVNHLRFNEISKKKIIYEIENNIKFLKKIRVCNKYWIMCYPHGSYNKFTLKYLHNKNFFLGLTVKKGIEDIRKMNKLKIKRIDCNEVDNILNKLN